MAWSVRDNEVRMKEGITLDEWSKEINSSTLEVVNDLTTGGTNKVLSAEQGKKLNEGKIDDVELSGNELIFKCNGVEKKRITLPTGAGA